MYLKKHITQDSPNRLVNEKVYFLRCSGQFHTLQKKKKAHKASKNKGMQPQTYELGEPEVTVLGQKNGRNSGKIKLHEFYLYITYFSG